MAKVYLGSKKPRFFALQGQATPRGIAQKKQGYGFASRWTATLSALTEEAIKSSVIEGMVLDPDNVRSSLACRLGLDIGGLKDNQGRNVDCVLEMMLDATQKF